MAQKNCACFACGECDVTLGAYVVELQVGHPGFSGWGQYSWHVEMRPDTDTGRCIVLADVRKQEQHQERAPARRDIDAPCRVVAALVVAGLARKAEVDVPSEVAGIILGGKSHDEVADVRARLPPARPHELVEGIIKDGSVGGLPE